MVAERPQNKETEPLSSSSETGDVPPAQDDPALEMLREILLSHYSRRVASLEAEIDELERRITDKNAFVAMITPVLGDAIRRKIRDAREEMIEALYPVIGQTVLRAVSEAMRDLARTLDARVRTSFNIQALGRRLQARASGVSSAEMILRESLPFNVAEVFLIHRETGLLLWHISRDPDASPDSDIISSMLTAIRDFVQESFGRGKDGDLEEIQYGERSVLLEAAQHAYLAVVIDGIEPTGFRARMRQRLIEVGYAHEGVLREYDGDPTPLAPVEEPLRSLITVEEPHQLSSTQKRVLGMGVGVIAVCFLATCAVGVWGWRSYRSTPAPVAVVVEPTAIPTFTPLPSPTVTATPSPSPTPTHTPTHTPSPTATPTPDPVIGLMISSVWLREKPAADAPRLGVFLERGQPIEVLTVFGEWYQVRWAAKEDSEVVGWAPAPWVGTITTIPARLITPTASP